MQTIVELRGRTKINEYCLLMGGRAQQILETFTCHGRATMNNSGMMLDVIVQTDTLGVTSHVDGDVYYFRMCVCTILPGGTTVTGKGRNYQRQ